MVVLHNNVESMIIYLIFLLIEFKRTAFVSNKIICYNVKVFTLTFEQFNVSLLEILNT